LLNSKTDDIIFSRALEQLFFTAAYLDLIYKIVRAAIPIATMEKRKADENLNFIICNKSVKLIRRRSKGHELEVSILRCIVLDRCYSIYSIFFNSIYMYTLA
jgi:hypothetical protein